ncbi:MAG TPA: hypothetical protein IGS52_12415 [Oscillatoriaceae cyanobacterium M33_DOE_052]|nr:hypothetical protein [Oscillatoriaceae cyanobacterium M33_DOE_052]
MKPQKRKHFQGKIRLMPVTLLALLAAGLLSCSQQVPPRDVGQTPVVAPTSVAEMLNVDTKLYIKNYTYVFDA